METEVAASARDVKMEDVLPPTTDLAQAPSAKNSTVLAGDGLRGTPYRSWKKKFQKMRVVFDEKMGMNEKLYTEEAVALQTTKRLAVEIDRLLDLLIDVNNAPQIPAAKRINLGLPIPSKGSKTLDIDVDGGWEKRFHVKGIPPVPAPQLPIVSLRSLLHDVSHNDLAATAQQNPGLLKEYDLSDDIIRALAATPDGTSAPVLDLHKSPGDAKFADSFLAADDLDNYLWEIDHNAAGRALLSGAPPPPMIPTLAPFAHTADTFVSTIGKGGATTSSGAGWEEFFNRSISKQDLPSILTAPPNATTRDSILKNPTSVYNWLRQHAPKQVFLQEGEASAAAAAAAAAAVAAFEDDGKFDYHHYQGSGSGNGIANGRKRKSGVVSVAVSEKGGRSGRSSMGGSGGRGNKRASMLVADDATTLADTSDDLEPGTPVVATGGGGRSGGTAPAKRKRAAAGDDDVGYKPKSSTAAGAVGAIGAAAGAAGVSSTSSRATKRKRKSEVKDEDETGMPSPAVAKKRLRKTGGGGGGVGLATGADEFTDAISDAATPAATKTEAETDAATEAEVDIDADMDVEAAEGEHAGAPARAAEPAASTGDTTTAAAVASITDTTPASFEALYAAAERAASPR